MIRIFTTANSDEFLAVILAAKTARARPFRTRQEARTIARITIRNSNDVSLSWLQGEINLHSKRKPATRLWAYHEYGSVVDQYDKRASVHQWIIFRFVGNSYLIGIMEGLPVIRPESETSQSGS